MSKCKETNPMDDKIINALDDAKNICVSISNDLSTEIKKLKVEHNERK